MQEAVERVFMKRREQLTAIIEREGTGYVSLCPERDIASQGATVEEARANLREAIELFFEAADPSEVERGCTRKSTSPAWTSCVGKLRVLSGRSPR
jgi:predicted RNase H-like HicB family nuclease